MKNKITLILFVLSLIGFGVGYVLTNVYYFGICERNNISCHQLFERPGNELLFGMGALALIFLVLLFIPHAFNAWKKFAIWFVPLAIIIFITAPEPHGWVSPIPAPEQVFRWISGFYVVASIILIVWEQLKLSKGKGI